MYKDNNLNVISTTSNQAYFAVANILLLTQNKHKYVSKYKEYKIKDTKSCKFPKCF